MPEADPVLDYRPNRPQDPREEHQVIDPERLADRLQGLVCDCEKPEADHWNFGMCRACKRKPVALMARKVNQ